MSAMLDHSRALDDPAVSPISGQAVEQIQNGAQVVDIVHLVVMVFTVVIYRLYDPLCYSTKL